MPDHSNITPPPPEPLPTDRKRTIRARLLAAANTPPASAPRRWLVPGLAAAAVLTIIGAAAFAASRDGESGAPGSGGQVPVGGTTTSTTATTPSADASTAGDPGPVHRPPNSHRSPPSATPDGARRLQPGRVTRTSSSSASPACMVQASPHSARPAPRPRGCTRPSWRGSCVTT